MLSICLNATVTLVFILICFTLLKHNYLFIKIIFVLNYLIFIISYLYTILINPGIPERKYYSEYIMSKNIDETKWMKCQKCNIFIPRELHISHCYDCDICVKEQDHHCPWTGKCIGKNNLKSFYVFIYSLLTFFVNIFVTIYSCMFYMSKNKKEE